MIETLLKWIITTYVHLNVASLENVDLQLYLFNTPYRKVFCHQLSTHPKIHLHWRHYTSLFPFPKYLRVNTKNCNCIACIQQLNDKGMKDGKVGITDIMWCIASFLARNQDMSVIAATQFCWHINQICFRGVLNVTQLHKQSKCAFIN